MRKANDNERLTCEKCSQTLVPLQVWDSQLPDGKPVTYGMIPPHHVFYSGPCEPEALTGIVSIVKAS